MTHVLPKYSHAARREGIYLNSATIACAFTPQNTTLRDLLSSMVNPESRVPPELILPLDPALLSLTEQEKEFFRVAISSDDEKLRERKLDIQKRYASLSITWVT